MLFVPQVLSEALEHVLNQSDRMQVWGSTIERPVVLERVEPKYPDMGKIDMDGVTIVEVWIRADGSVAQTKVLKSLPLGISEAAAEAVRKWSFKPGKIRGVAVPVVQNVAVRFSSRGR